MPTVISSISALLTGFSAREAGQQGLFKALNYLDHSPQLNDAFYPRSWDPDDIPYVSDLQAALIISHHRQTSSDD